MTAFDAAFRKTLDKSRRNHFRDNWDYRRFGPMQKKGCLKDAIKRALALPLLRRKPSESEIVAYWAKRMIGANAADFGWLYDRLGDPDSRETLLKVLAYRMLGHRKVKLPLNSKHYWEKMAELDARARNAELLDIGLGDRNLRKLNLSPEGCPIELFARPAGVFCEFVVQQYRCELPDRVIEVSPGDVVIDAGGYHGDTALYFAHKAKGGQVYSFEFFPDNISVFEKNMALNRELSRSVHLVDRPLWSSSDMLLFIEGKGAGAHVMSAANGPSAQEVTTISIDDFAGKQCLARIDFIKMDIEGAELEALKGARESIKKHRPKLAISVYHYLHDFWSIPQWIDSLGLDYRFALRHFSIHAEETVLFAVADR